MPPIMITRRLESGARMVATLRAFVMTVSDLSRSAPIRLAIAAVVVPESRMMVSSSPKVEMFIAEPLGPTLDAASHLFAASRLPPTSSCAHGSVWKIWYQISRTCPGSRQRRPMPGYGGSKSTRRDTRSGDWRASGWATVAPMSWATTAARARPRTRAKPAISRATTSRA